MEIERKEFLARGKRGIAYTGFLKGNKVLVKEHNPTSTTNTIRNEAHMLQKLNNISIGPTYISYDGRQLIREFIAGERIEDFLQHATSTEAKSIIRQSLNQCKAMDDIGINKFEMNHPYKHILVEKKGKQTIVTMIDFERCRHTEKPKNITQFCQYIARIKPLLEITGMSIDEEEIKDLGMKYKQQGYDKKMFNKLIGMFR